MDDTTALIPSAHRTIRWLDAQESAFAGELVTDGEAMRVRVATRDVPEPLWGFAEAEHVAGIRDLVRSRTGQDVLLPWCTDPVEAFLGRRATAEQPLTNGEVVTLVGSLLRGVDEVGDAPVRGRWWLTDEARPTFALGEGSGCAAGAAQIITRVRDGCTDRMLDRVLAEIAAVVEDPRMVRRSQQRWEQELTELAAPRALVRDVFPPERISDIPLDRERAPHDAGVVNEQRERRAVWRARAVQLGERLRERLPSFGSRARALRVREATSEPTRSTGRGRMLLVGAAVAGVVLGAGLLWPSEGDDSAAMEQTTVVMGPTARAEPGDADADAADPPKPEARKRTPDAKQAAPEADAVADGSLGQAVTALLEQITACAQEQDADCAHAVADGAGETVLPRLEAADAERSISPVEDYGDIAVVRLGAAGEAGEKMLVLVKAKSGWLVRDVYDVADQPSAEG